ncbi:MAG: hypothetical protein K2L45_04825 [Muribaculaceae bacterium]|nr:hypothetical protein [Muribaculaceae bacterium]
MEDIKTTHDLFVNIRRSIRLLYEYQKRMQGTMFHIKSVLKLSYSVKTDENGSNSVKPSSKHSRPDTRIEINKLFSLAPRQSKDYGETQLWVGNWAWDYIYPMVMEYYLGENSDGNFRLSVIQVTDDGYYLARKQNISPDRCDTYTFSLPEESNSIVLFVMEVKTKEAPWAKRWKRDSMEENLTKWMIDSREVIDDTTNRGNHFIVMKFPISDLLNDISIEKVLNNISLHIKKITGIQII